MYYMHKTKHVILNTSSIFPFLTGQTLGAVNMGTLNLIKTTDPWKMTSVVFNLKDKDDKSFVVATDRGI